MGKFKKAFRRLSDPRAANARHDLLEVFVIALGRGPVRSRDLLGHGGVRTGQGRPAAAVSAPAARDSRVTTPSAGCSVCSIRKPSRPHSGTSWRHLPRPIDSISPGWWRSTARPCEEPTNAVRASEPLHMVNVFAVEARMSLGPAEGSWPQRDHGGVGGIGAAVPRRLHRYGRRAALPSCDGQDGARSRWRLRAGH